MVLNDSIPTKDKVKTRIETRELLRHGVLKRRKCAVCGSENAQAHHVDYRNPYKVKWLCRQHHIDLHNKLKSYMGYSVKPILHNYKGNDNLQKLMFQIIVNRTKAYQKTDIKVTASQWNGERVINHPNAVAMNRLLISKRIEIESEVIKALQKQNKFTSYELKTVINPRKAGLLFCEFIFDLADELKGKLTPGRLKHYEVIGNKITEFSVATSTSNINTTWLYSFERWLRDNGVSNNTINSNMKIVKPALANAARKGLIDEKQFKDYRVPKYIQPLPEYLTIEEIEKLHSLVEIIEKPAHKLAGYYFLLSCYTGYRISDAKAFDASKMISDNKITIKAKKNNNVVSIPIYSKLQSVLNFVSCNPLDLSEAKIREYVKELCSFAGIKKHVKFHTARHSFAMMLLKKGFTIDEVSELIGDNKEITKIYARITNKHLENKFKEKFI